MECNPLFVYIRGNIIPFFRYYICIYSRIFIAVQDNFNQKPHNFKQSTTPMTPH